jgi:hypothetical protein
VKNKITEDKICKCSLWGKILHRNKVPQVVQIQRKSILDNQSKKKLRIEKTLNSLFSLLTCMRKQTAPIQKHHAISIRQQNQTALGKNSAT